MRDGVYVHKYLGCLAVFSKNDYGYETVYGFAGDEDLPSYGLYLIKELLQDAPKCWSYIGAL